MYDSMSFEELHESIIEGIDDARLALMRLSDEVDDKCLINNIIQRLENITNEAEQLPTAAIELNFNQG